MLASWGQRVLAREPRRDSREYLVESGYFTMETILARCGGRRRVLPVVRVEVRHKDHMPVSSPFVIVLTDPGRRELSRRAHSTRTPHRDRARAVVTAGAGDANAAIARQVGVSVDTVRKWRKRFVTGRLAGLRDAPRPGRPRRLPDAVRAQVIALACELPATSGVALSRWSSPELARELAARCQLAGQVQARNPPCVAGWPRMPSSRGSAGPGSRSGTPTSRSRPSECWTCMPGSGMGNRWAP